MNLSKKITNGERQFHLSELKKAKNIAEASDILNVGEEIGVSAKSMGGSYMVDFKKTHKGYKITYASDVVDLDRKKFKSLKKLIKKLPEPMTGTAGVANFMDR